MASVRTDFENGDEDLEVEIEFDYEPSEPKTWNHPGCPENASIHTVTIVETNQEIFFLPEFEKEMEEKVLDLKEDNFEPDEDYKGYGYMWEKR